MTDTVWGGFLQLSLASCRVFLAPVTGIGERAFQSAPCLARELIEIAHFIPRNQLDQTRLRTSYYVYPDGAIAADILDALRLAMGHAGRDAIAYVARDDDELMLLLQPRGEGLILSTLRRPEASDPAAADPRPESEIPLDMIEIAEMLIARRAFDGDANLLHDRYEETQRRPAADAIAAGTDAGLAALSEAAPAQPESVILAAEPEAAADEQVAGQQAGMAAPREIQTEILLHFTDLGDRQFAEPGWAGNPGGRRQIEAISIRPHQEFAPGAIEYRVFAAAGRATPWVSEGKYAGTRGRELPLTGVAVRPAPEMQDRIDVVYEGCFFEGGVVGPHRNGETCVSPVPDDRLEALRVTLVERPPKPASPDGSEKPEP